MALYVFDGIPGNGKTYSAMALRILPHLAAGGVVVTNIDVVPEGVGRWIKQRTGRVWDPSRLRIITGEQCPNFFHHVPRGTKECPVLVVLDEIHLWFNARDWSKNDVKCRETFELATQHRKFNLDIVLISQHLSNMDGQFLKLLAGLSRFKDLSKIHPPGMPWLRIPIWRFLAIHYQKDGRTLLKRDWLIFDKLVGASYNTDAVLKGGEVMAGAEVVERQELARDPEVSAKMAKLRKILLAVLVGIALGVAVWRFMQKDEPAPVQAAPAAPAVKAEKPAPAPARETDTAAAPPPPKPVLWVDRQPAVPVVIVKSVSGSLHLPRLLVELDGASQWLIPGGYCTRGRIATIRRLSVDLKLHEISLWEDAGERIVIRGLLQNAKPASTGVPGSSFGPADPGSQTVPGVAAPPPAAAAGFYQSPQAFIPQ